jgi:PAS domain S-box-containing protein
MAEPTGEIREDCPTWREFTGQSVEEIQGFGWLEAVHPDDRERTRHIWKQAAGTGSFYESEFRVRRADCEWRHLSVRGVSVREHGEIHKWIGFCRDVTEQVNYVQLLLRERDFSNAVIDLLPGIFYITDEEGKPMRWNRNAEIITGYSGEEIAQMHGYELIHPEDRERVIETRKRLHETGAYHEMEAGLVTKAGKHIPLFINGRRITFEGKQCMMGTALDVSRLKEAERELRDLNAALEERVKERTRQLEESNKQLGETNKELEAFSYTVSHDLRAPLQAVQGFSEILKEDYGEQLRGEGEELVQRIADAGERMSRLIDDVLRYSRTGRTALKLVTVPMAPLIRFVTRDFVLQLKEIGGDLEVAPDLPDVKGDPTLLAQVFSNLFQNAINYRRKEVPLKVTVGAQRADDVVVVSVRDNGVGIAPENREKVFQAFQRLHSQREVPGSGLGLATVKKAVETMGGKVWMESQVGKGTTFFVRLKAG